MYPSGGNDIVFCSCLLLEVALAPLTQKMSKFCECLEVDMGVSGPSLLNSVSTL